MGQAVQELVKAGTVKREDLFIQTKFTHARGHTPGQEPFDPNAPIKEQVLSSFVSSLGHFNTDYIDSYILHGPKVHGKEFGKEDWEVYRTLEELYDAGKVYRRAAVPEGRD